MFEDLLREVLLIKVPWEVVFLLDHILWEVLLMEDMSLEILLLYLEDVLWEILLFGKVYEFDGWVMNHPCQVFVYSVL